MFTCQRSLRSCLKRDQLHGWAQQELACDLDKVMSHMDGEGPGSCHMKELGLIRSHKVIVQSLQGWCGKVGEKG